MINMAKYLMQNDEETKEKEAERQMELAMMVTKKQESMCLMRQR
jgi:hypothetical protein